MSSYILTILGIVLAGILIDIIVPTGKINKYIKSIFAIFVVAVILMPVVKFIAKSDDITINYTDYEIEQNLMNYIFSSRVTAYENEIIEVLENNGLSNIDIKINYSINSNELSLNSCEVNLKNMTSSNIEMHNNRYEFIAETIKEITNLTDEVIIFYE